MKIGKNSTPPSRQGKKQIIAFLRPKQLKAAYRKAHRENKSNQEIIGEALNAVFKEHGLPDLVQPGHNRIVRRNQGKARMRTDETGPECRAGTHSFAGWFDESLIERLKLFSSENDMPVQTIIERGIYLLTDEEPDRILGRRDPMTVKVEKEIAA